MNKFKEIQYKITGAFASLDEGDIINAILVDGDTDIALVFHPWIKGECPSFEFCKFNYQDKTYSSIQEDQYINSSLSVQKKLFGNLKWKRKFFKKC